jgi:hypothetical protein
VFRSAAAKPPLSYRRLDNVETYQSGGCRHRTPKLALCAGLVVATFVVTGAAAQMQRVADDALVIDRVAELSKRDLPRDLLERLISQDIDLLRGKRADGTFEFATYERLEAARETQSFSVNPRKEQMETIELKGAFVYRVLVDVPKRRLIVGRNRPLWIERVDVEYVGTASSQPQRTSVEIKAWIQPGEMKPVDLPDVARQLTARVIAAADPKQGYGNVEITLVQARIVDSPDSPYADAVASAKAIQRALENSDIKSIRAMAQRMRTSLGGSRVVAVPTPAASTLEVRPSASTDVAAQLELQTELQVIEDLLTGSEGERREGLDRLHQMIRRMRR